MPWCKHRLPGYASSTLAESDSRNHARSGMTRIISVTMQFKTHFKQKFKPRYSICRVFWRPSKLFKTTITFKGSKGIYSSFISGQQLAKPPGCEATRATLAQLSASDNDLQQWQRLGSHSAASNRQNFSSNFCRLYVLASDSLHGPCTRLVVQ